MNVRSAAALPTFTWADIDLVVFDVDGTLYDQRRLRSRMALELGLHTLRRRDMTVVGVLRSFRRVREAMGDSGEENFEASLLAATAGACGVPEGRVKEIVSVWMYQRPLRHLLRCRYSGLTALFEGIRKSGRSIGVFSDYPAEEKIKALGLFADAIVTAADVGALKPDPRGLELVIRRANASPARTVMIGDRIDRDGFAAQRADAHCLIRARRAASGWTTFQSFEQPLFDEIRV